VRVLVTGAGGFVGIHLVRRFAAAGADVDALVRRDPDPVAAAFVAGLQGRVTWRHGDVTDRAGLGDLTRAVAPDVLVHAAAVTFTGPQERAQPARVFDVNAGGTLNALEAAREAEVGTFVYVSSGGLYGAAPPEPALDESATMRPGNLYAIAKIASEHLCVRYADLSGMRVRVGRLGTAYGPLERASGSRSNLSAVTQVLALAGTLARPLRVAGAEIARDFVHIDDVAEAFHALAVAADLPHVIYNVGAPRSEPLALVLDTLAAEIPGFAWEAVSDPAEADVVQVDAQARAAMDVARLIHDTAWRPAWPLASGVRATLAYLRAHPGSIG
jgi:UDP-glucuronate 4-epimerase